MTIRYLCFNILSGKWKGNYFTEEIIEEISILEISIPRMDDSELITMLKESESKFEGVTINTIPFSKAINRRRRKGFKECLHLLLELEKKHDLRGARVSIEGESDNVRITIHLAQEPKKELAFIVPLSSSNEIVALGYLPRPRERRVINEKEEVRIHDLLEKPELVFPFLREERFSMGRYSLVYDLFVPPESLFSSTVERTLEISFDDLRHALQEYASQPLTTCLPKGRKPNGEAVLEMFMRKALRDNKRHELPPPLLQDYLQIIERRVEEEKPILLTWLGFPFKNPDDLITYRKYPDLNEAIALAHLMRYDTTIRQVYEPGIKWIILCEGETYKRPEILDHPDPHAAEKYKEGIEEFIRRLGWKEKIELRDLGEVLPQDFWDEFRKQQKEIFEEGVVKSDILHKHFPVMFKSIPSKELGIDTGIGSNPSNIFACNEEEVRRKVDATTMEAIKNSNPLSIKMIEGALKRAIGYGVFHEVKDKLNLHEMFKEQGIIYCTVTEKHGRYCIRLSERENEYLPHHGIPFVEVPDIKSIDVDSLLKLLTKEYRNREFVSVASERNKCIAVYLQEDREDTPFIIVGE